MYQKRRIQSSWMARVQEFNLVVTFNQGRFITLKSCMIGAWCMLFLSVLSCTLYRTCFELTRARERLFFLRVFCSTKAAGRGGKLMFWRRPYGDGLIEKFTKKWRKDFIIRGIVAISSPKTHRLWLRRLGILYLHVETYADIDFVYPNTFLVHYCTKLSSTWFEATNRMIETVFRWYRKLYIRFFSKLLSRYKSNSCIVMKHLHICRNPNSLKCVQ